jgi:hypothetical protein
MIWASITGNLWRAACAVLAGLLLALWVQLHGLPIIGGGVLSDLRIAQTTITNIRNSQDDATAAQVAVNAETAYKSAKIAEVNNVQAPEYYDRVKRAAADSVRPAPRCATSAPDLPGTDSPATVNDGDASAPGMVSVASDDWAKVTDAAGQAVMCVIAGRALIDAGLAVEGVE